MSDILDQLASNFRPLLEEIAREFFQDEGVAVAGLLFATPGDPVVFATEAVRVDENEARSLENTTYRYSPACPFLSPMISASAGQAQGWRSLETTRAEAMATKDGFVDLSIAYTGVFPGPPPSDILRTWFISLRRERHSEDHNAILYLVDLHDCVQAEDRRFDHLRHSIFFVAHLVRAVLQDELDIIIASKGDGPEKSLLDEMLECVPARLDHTEVRERRRRSLFQHLVYTDGELKTKRHFAHELRTSLAALASERDRLSENGHIALDYITLWQRFASNSLAKDGLPHTLEAMFVSDSAFLRGVLTLALVRLSEESRIPSWHDGTEYVSLSPDDMTDNRVRWLGDSPPLEIQKAVRWTQEHVPPACRLSCERMLRAVILKVSIGAFHHLLDHVFADNQLVNDTVAEVFKECRRGYFAITVELDPACLKVRIQNAGHSEASRSGQVLSSDKIGSNRIGETSWELQDNCMLTLYPARKVSVTAKGSAIWETLIAITTGVKTDEDTRLL